MPVRYLCVSSSHVAARRAISVPRAAWYQVHLHVAATVCTGMCWHIVGEQVEFAGDLVVFVNLGICVVLSSPAVRKAVGLR